MTAESVVRSLLDHLATGEAEPAIDLLDVEIVWRNTLMPDLRGPQVAKALRDMVARGIGFEVVHHHVAADGDVVLTDRTDVLSCGRWRSEFKVRGTFEVRDGKVAVWDDAFSWIDLIGSGVIGLAKSLLPG